MEEPQDVQMEPRSQVRRMSSSMDSESQDNLRSDKSAVDLGMVEATAIGLPTSAKHRGF